MKSLLLSALLIFCWLPCTLIIKLFSEDICSTLTWSVNFIKLYVFWAKPLKQPVYHGLCEHWPVPCEVVHEESVWKMGTSTVLKKVPLHFVRSLNPPEGWHALAKPSQAEPFRALTWSNGLFSAWIWAKREGRAVPAERLTACAEAKHSHPQGAYSGTMVRDAAEWSTTSDVHVIVLPKPCWRHLKVL